MTRITSAQCPPITLGLSKKDRYQFMTNEKSADLPMIHILDKFVNIQESTLVIIFVMLKNESFEISRKSVIDDEILGLFLIDNLKSYRRRSLYFVRREIILQLDCTQHGTNRIECKTY